MRIDDLTLKDIGYARALAEHQHFGRAAAACHISQPALSQQIARLEQQLGLQLFERNKRSVTVTTLGQQWLDHTQPLWDSANHLLELAQSTQALTTHPWRMGIIASACPFVLPLVLTTLRQDYPALTVHEGQTDELASRLRHGELDVVWAADTLPKDDTLRVHHFYEEPFLLVTAKNSPNPLPVVINAHQDIDPARLLLLADGHCLSDQTLGLCGLSGQSASITSIKAQQLSTLVLMAAENMGIAVLPALAKPAFSHLPVNWHTLDQPSDSRQMVWYCRRSSAIGNTFCQQAMPILQPLLLQALTS
jgi:LysR family transcriptional regulator, hydrogen peroxide-inducible genes activator